MTDEALHPDADIERSRRRDAMSGRYTTAFSVEEAIDALRELDGAAGTSDVADQMGCATRTAYGKLTTATEDGRVERQRVGNSILWVVDDDDFVTDGGQRVDDTGHGEQFPNLYLAATILPPGRRHLDAVRQFLEEEQHRLHGRLKKIENDDGSIPDDAADEWSMAKGKLDQTRLFYGLVIRSILTDETGQGVGDAE